MASLAELQGCAALPKACRQHPLRIRCLPGLTRVVQEGRAWHSAGAEHHASAALAGSAVVALSCSGSGLTPFMLNQILINKYWQITGLNGCQAKGTWQGQVHRAQRLTPAMHGPDRAGMGIWTGLEGSPRGWCRLPLSRVPAASCTSALELLCTAMSQTHSPGAPTFSPGCPGPLLPTASTLGPCAALPLLTPLGFPCSPSLLTDH